MTIHVIFDTKQKQYVVSHDERQIAVLPLVYLEGRKSPHLGPADIEQAFAKAYEINLPAVASEIQKRNTALASLGLISA